MATVKKSQKGMSMAKSLDKTSVFGKNYTPATDKEKAQADSALKAMKAKAAVGKPFKSGGKMKAKDGKWIQKAVNPKHKGYCTPMTKATCTPRRKALAMTLKKMAKSRKGK